jgi:hypothetical protein
MKLAALRFIALLVLLPGLVGLVANAALSTHYFDSRSHYPQPDRMQTIPRTLNGQVVYLTDKEDQQLDLLRYYGLRCFIVGVGLGLIYLGAVAVNLERWHETEPEHD